MRAWAFLMLVLTWGAGLVSCGKAAPAAAGPPKTWSTPMKVVVSIPPLKGLVEPLLPPGSTVTVLIKPGTSEHGYEPTAGDVRDVINADLVVWIGGMEPAVDTLSKANPRPARVDLRLADALKIEVHDEDEHGHGHAGEEEHEHGGEGDPHVWLDPVKAEEVVDAVFGKVCRLREKADSPTAGGVAHANLVADLRKLDQRYRDGLARSPNRTIVVAHDAYGWLAKRYGLQTIAISGLTAAEPTPGSLAKAREAVISNKLKAVFTEPQISDRAARSIAEKTGADVLKLDPLGDGDYFKMMYANLQALQKALGIEPQGEPAAK